jgi:hypothetical protein
MKSVQYLFVAVIGISMISCQKSYNPPDLVIPPGGGTTPPATGGGSQLSKMVVSEKNNNSTYTYQYDGNGRLSDATMDALISGQTLKSSWHFVRDNSGKLLQYLVKNNTQFFPAAGITYTFHYLPGSSTVAYQSASYDIFGLTQKDSIVFSYANGKVSGYTSYTDYANSGYEASVKFTYVYDSNGNLIDEKEYGMGVNPSPDLVATTTYEYDDKNNALQLGFESYVLGVGRYFSKNNPTKTINTFYGPSSIDKYTTVISYQYNSANKPVSAVATDPAASGSPGTITYTY